MENALPLNDVTLDWYVAKTTWRVWYIHNVLRLMYCSIHGYIRIHCVLHKATSRLPRIAIPFRACVRASPSCSSACTAYAPFPRPGSIHHAQASTLTHGRLHGQRRSESRRATPWRSFMARPRAQLRHMHACEATDREKEEWRWRGQRRWRGETVSKPVRNSEREQRGCAETVSSLFSAAAFARSRLLHSWGGSPLARRISFLAQRRTEEIHRRDLVPFRNAVRRVKINYAPFHRGDIYASTNFGCFRDENRNPHVLRVENITKIANEARPRTDISFGHSTRRFILFMQKNNEKFRAW